MVTTDSDLHLIGILPWFLVFLAALVPVICCQPQTSGPFHGTCEHNSEYHVNEYWVERNQIRLMEVTYAKVKISLYVWLFLAVKLETLTSTRGY